MTDRAILLLEEQQKAVRERTAPWMVAEQLKDICRREPASAELVALDLENPALSIVEAEKQIKAFADQHKSGGFSCVIPAEAEKILRKFYGLPDPPVQGMPENPGAVVLNFEDFLR